MLKPHALDAVFAWVIGRCGMWSRIWEWKKEPDMSDDAGAVLAVLIIVVVG